MIKSLGAAVVALALVPRAGLPDPVKAPAEPPSPAFVRVKSLAGEWEGSGAGSAVMITTDPGGKFDTKRVK